VHRGGEQRGSRRSNALDETGHYGIDDETSSTKHPMLERGDEMLVADHPRAGRDAAVRRARSCDPTRTSARFTRLREGV